MTGLHELVRYYLSNHLNHLLTCPCRHIQKRGITWQQLLQEADFKNSKWKTHCWRRDFCGLGKFHYDHESFGALNVISRNWHLSFKKRLWQSYYYMGAIDFPSSSGDYNSNIHAFLLHLKPIGFISCCISTLLSPDHLPPFFSLLIIRLNGTLQMVFEDCTFAYNRRADECAASQK